MKINNNKIKIFNFDNEIIQKYNDNIHNLNKN